MKIELCDLKAQYATIQPEIDDAIKSVLANTNFIQGQQVRLLEQQFASFCGARFGVATGSGTDALHLVLLALGIGPGDEVITTTHTFTATAAAVCHCGGTPVFVDVDPHTYNIDPGKIEEKITTRTKAILAVHLYGQPVDMDPISNIASAHGIPVVEDAAQAHGAEYKGKRIGSLGQAACFSFYPGKNLGAYGDAGMIVTDDQKMAEWCAMMADHGRTDKYSHAAIGYGKRMDTINAAVLLVKLRYLEKWTEARRRAASSYNRLLAGLVETPFEPIWAKSAYHQYVIRVDDRDRLFNELREAGIGVGIHYPIPLHLQPAYAYLGHRPGDFPEAEKAANSVLSLPIYPEITEEQQQYVVQRLRTALVR